MNTTPPTPPDRELSPHPLRVVQDPARSHLIFAPFVFALCASLAVYFFAVAGPSSGRDYVAARDPALSWLFLTLAVGAVIYFAIAAKSRKRGLRVYQLDSDLIICRDGLGERWRAHQDEYLHLRRFQKSVPTYSKHGGHALVDTLEACHPNPERSFEIHSIHTRKAAGSIEDQATAWAAALNVGIVRDGENQLPRRADQLEQPLAALPQQPATDSEPDSTATLGEPPKEIDLDESPFRITARVPRANAVTPFVFVPLGWIGVHLARSSGQSSHPWIATLVLVAFAMTLVPWTVRYVVSITPEWTRVDCRVLGLRLRRRQLASRAIIDVRWSASPLSSFSLHTKESHLHLALLSSRASRWLVTEVQRQLRPRPRA